MFVFSPYIYIFIYNPLWLSELKAPSIFLQNAALVSSCPWFTPYFTVKRFPGRRQSVVHTLLWNAVLAGNSC